MPIEFDCPHCGKHLSLWDELAGQQGTCPECKQSITVPDPRAVMMQCPFCEGEIPADAVLCTHCGRDLKKGEALETRVNEPTAVQKVAAETLEAILGFLWRYKFILLGLAALLGVVIYLFSLAGRHTIGPSIGQ